MAYHYVTWPFVITWLHTSRKLISEATTCLSFFIIIIISLLIFVVFLFYSYIFYLFIFCCCCILWFFFCCLYISFISLCLFIYLFSPFEILVFVSINLSKLKTSSPFSLTFPFSSEVSLLLLFSLYPSPLLFLLSLSHSFLPTYLSLQQILRCANIFL